MIPANQQQVAHAQQVLQRNKGSLQKHIQLLDHYLQQNRIIMNIVLLEAEQTQSEFWKIDNPRQIQHLSQHVQLNAGDTFLKVGIRNGERYLTEVISVSEQQIRIRPIQLEAIPTKLPVHFNSCCPSKVLRRMVMDAVTLGVERISLIHSYRVDKAIGKAHFTAAR